MNTAILLQWHYLIFLLPFGAAALLMLLSGLSIGHHGVGHGVHAHGVGASGHGHAAGGAHGHAGANGHAAPSAHHAPGTPSHSHNAPAARHGDQQHNADGAKPGQNDNLNKTDAAGKKQGHWVKLDADKKKMYEGNFIDNIPVGKFTYYYDIGIPWSVTVFSLF